MGGLSHTEPAAWTLSFGPDGGGAGFLLKDHHKIKSCFSYPIGSKFRAEPVLTAELPLSPNIEVHFWGLVPVSSFTASPWLKSWSH